MRSRRADPLVGRSLADEPFFLFLHTYEVHHPYDPDLDLLARFAPDYDGELPTGDQRRSTAS